MKNSAQLAAQVCAPHAPSSSAAQWVFARPRTALSLFAMGVALGLPLSVGAQAPVAGESSAPAAKSTALKPKAEKKDKAKSKAASTATATDSATSAYYVHTAVKGDTLSGLAHRYLEKKRDWKSLDKANDVSDPNLIPVGKQVRIPQAAMRAEQSGAEVISVKGASVANGKPIAAGAKLNEGDRVETPQDGFVAIRLADGSLLKVQSQSAVKLERARILANTGGVSDAVVGLQSGRMETAVNKQKAGARYEVRTPSSNMGVRGTVFRASSSIDGSKSASEVVEGLVAVGGQGEAAKGNAVKLAAGFGTVIEAGRPPAPPVALLSAPEFAASPMRIEADVPSVTVRSVTGAVGYRAQIARDREFNDVVANATGPSTALAFAPIAPGNYQLRVRAIDRQGLEGVDAMAPLRVLPASPKMIPAAGVVIEPAEGAVLALSAPRFVWDPVTGVSTYRLQVARDRSFTQLVVDQTVTVVGFVPPMPLVAGEYFWRVASVDESEVGRYSPVRAFVVRSGKLTLALPVVQGAAVTVRWSGDGRDEAEVWIATDENFQNVVRRERVLGGEYRVSDLGRGHYFAKVRSRVGEQEGEWSVYEAFSVFSGTAKR